MCKLIMQLISPVILLAINYPIIGLKGLKGKCLVIDKIVLHIFFKDHNLIKIGAGDNEKYILPITRIPLDLAADHCTIDTCGNVTVSDLRTKFESLPSSLGSMAMKVYNDGMNTDPFVAIKCSPAKIAQGHNVYGHTDFKHCVDDMLSLLAVSHPVLFNMLDLTHINISEFDITYSAHIKSTKIRQAFVDYLKNVSKGQTKSQGDNYNTTVHFGAKNSRLKRLKVYLKYNEVKERIEKCKDEKQKRILESVVEKSICKDAVRFEATIKKRYLERNKVPYELKKFLNYLESEENFFVNVWNDAFANIFSSFKGKEMKILDDDVVFKKIISFYGTVNKKGNVSHTKANRVFAFYQTLKIMGFDQLKSNNSRATFHRNIAELEHCGFSRSYLQNLNKDTGCSITQIVQVIKIDFGKQVPDDYVKPDLLFPKLKAM